MRGEQPRWTADEDAIIREMGATTPPKEIQLDIPWRTVDAISSRVRTLGIRGHAHHWTREEEKYLWAEWGVDIHKIAAHLGRSVKAVYYKARDMGLQLGCPDGFESFDASAKRTGYLRSQLLRIMSWAGYRRRRRLTYEQSVRNQWIVDSGDVDDAVERWTHWLRITETIEEAAARLDTNHHRVRQALNQSGLALPAKPPRGCHWRVPISTIDEAWACVFGERRVA